MGGAAEGFDLAHARSMIEIVKPDAVATAMGRWTHPTEMNDAAAHLAIRRRRRAGTVYRD